MFSLILIDPYGEGTLIQHPLHFPGPLGETHQNRILDFTLLHLSFATDKKPASTLPWKPTVIER
jgi:hypothetical protein